MSWTSAAEIINLLKKQLGLNEDFFTIEKIWKKEVNINGVEISGYKNGTIFAQTQSSVASSELTIRKKDIIKKLNQYLGSPKIKNIKIKIE
ncbi:MAG: DUF721 domain-containing protein [Endomicrobium sp.]|jgi:hypothetical protein|nr:DUF721 domain-containing protein [Endomicrobium sp.]